MAIKFSQFNLRTDHTDGMYLVGYDGNQNIHITVDNLFDDFINGTENTIAMFGTDGTELADSILSQDAGATILTVAGQLNVDAAATFDTSITVTGDSTFNGNVILGDASTDLITQTGTLYLNGPVKDTTDTLGAVDQVLLSDATGELTFTDLADLHVGGAEVVEVPVKNVQGSALVKGDPVYISGSVGASGRLEVQLADASNALKMPAVGLLKQDLANNAEGFAVVTGKLRNLITDPIDGVNPTENDVIYVKPSGASGAALTTTKPVYGNFIQNVGKVGRVSTSNDGNLVVSSILRTNDIPNLTPGRLWVGSTGNTIESTVVHIDEANTRVGINQTTPLFGLDVNSTLRVVGTSTLGTMDVYGNINMNSGSINDLSDPTAAQDAATKAYVDSQVTAQDLDFQGDSGTGSVDLDSQSLDIAGGTYLTTSAASQTLTVNHDATTRTDTTSADTPGYGGTFTVVDSVSTNATGHLEAINVKTVTMPSADDTNTTYDLSGYGANNGASGIQLVGSDSTTDQVAITGAGTTLVTRSGNTITVTSNDQYTGTVTGSGAASVTGGQIPYWDATTNITGTTELNYSTNSGGSVGRVGIGNSNATAFSNSRLVVGSGSGGANMTLYGGGSNTNGIAFANGTSGNAQYRGQVRYNLQTNNLEFLTNGETFSRVYVDSAFDLNLVERSLNFRNSWPYAVGAYIDIPSNNQLSIGTNGSERMRIDSSGNVGIGVSPSTGYKLHVRRSTDAAIGFGLQSSEPSIEAVNDAVSANVPLRIYGSEIKSYTGGTERMRIDSSGRVGIGTTSPDKKLHISATNAAITDPLNVGNALRFTDDDPTQNNGQVTGTIEWETRDSNSAGVQSYITTISTNTGLGNLSFGTGAGGSATERMRITSGGNVGIGTTNPSNGKLQIDSTSNQISIQTGTSGDGRLHIGHFSNGTFIGTYGDDGGAADLIRFGTHSGDERMRITSGGNIGINTTNPTRLLHIAKGSASAVITLQRTNANSGGSYGALQWTASDDHTVASIDARADGDNEGAHLLFHTTTAATSNDPYGINERMRITSTGNVGIGTTSPQVTLDVSGSNTNGKSLQVRSGDVNTGTDSAQIIFSFNGNPFNANGYAHSIRTRHNSNSAAQNAIDFYTWTPSDSANVLGTNRVMTIDGTGNVGIGTASPGYKLAVSNSTHTLSVNPHSAGIDLHSTGNLAPHYQTDFTLYTGAIGSGTARLRVDSIGNVGIGTTSPSAKLNISGTGTGAAIDWSNTTATTGRNFRWVSLNSGGFAIEDLTAGGANRLTVGSTGNVGIGTNTPGVKLDVVGTIRTNNNSGHIINGSTNSVRTGCTYSPENVFISGSNNTVGGFNSGVIGSGNSIPCPEAPWLELGGNFIAGMNNTINNGYSHANAIFGQNHTLADSSVNVANAGSLISGNGNILFGDNSFSWGYQTFAQVSSSLTGGYQSVSFGSSGSMSIGLGCTASTGGTQYAFGTGVTTPTTATAAEMNDQFAIGRFNVYATSIGHLFAIGNGTSDGARNTALAVIGEGAYTNGQLSLNDFNGYSSSTYNSRLHVSGYATKTTGSSWVSVSDERLKSNIQVYEKGLSEILQITPKTFEFNGKAGTQTGQSQVGIIAQEIKDVLPESINTFNKKLEETDETETELYDFNQDPLVYTLLNAVKELSAKIDSLENRIQTLEAN